MHAARLDRSPRLRRVYALLEDGDWYSTRQIIRSADVCAVNSIIAELRQNGATIECTKRRDEHGQPRWFYRMTRGCPPTEQDHAA